MSYRFAWLLVLLVYCLPGEAQVCGPSLACIQEGLSGLGSSAPDLDSPRAEAPRMSPDLALSVYASRSERQAGALASYTSTTLVDADLPDALQQGRFELRSEYVAPAILRFTPVRFTGDRFVKSNVINRFLNSEVQHVEKQDRAATAINSRNYSFNFKRTEPSGGRWVHIYAVKPRRKVPGLFKGEIALDAMTGSLRRATGTMVKSPSFFIRKIEFEQEYADVDDFTLPVRLHSTARARLIGRVVIDVLMRDYSLLAQAKDAVTGIEPEVRPIENQAY